MVELRLYYDDNGNVLFYTCDKPEGKYIVIDNDVYAQCRFDIKVLDGKIINPEQSILITKMVQDDGGIACAKEDINIIVDDSYSGDKVKWKIKQHEFKYS